MHYSMSAALVAPVAPEPLAVPVKTVKGFAQVFKGNPFRDGDGQFSTKDNDADGQGEGGSSPFKGVDYRSSGSDLSKAGARAALAGLSGAQMKDQARLAGLDKEQTQIVVDGAKANLKPLDNLLKEWKDAGIKAKRVKDTLEIEDSYIAGQGEKTLAQRMKDLSPGGMYDKYLQGDSPIKIVSVTGTTKATGPKDRDDFTSGHTVAKVKLGVKD